MNFLEFEKRLLNPLKVDFGETFNHTIELFKKVWLQGLLSILLGMLVMLPLMFVMYIPLFLIMIPLGLMSEAGQVSEEISIGLAILFGFLMIIIMLLMITVMTGLQLSFRAAFYKICKEKDLDEGVSSDEYFFFLKKKYFKKIFFIAFISVITILIASSLFIIPAIILAIPMMYLPVVFAFNPEMTEKELLRASLKIGMKYWWVTAGLTVVAYFLATFVGFLACGIGIYVTMNFIYLPVFLIYKSSIGFKNNSDIDRIGLE